MFWVDWNPARGSEQAGTRPALVVSTDAANQNPNYPNVIVATVSSQGRSVPTHVEVTPSPQNGLTRVSFVKCEQLMTISKARLGNKVGTLSQGHMATVDASIKKALSLL